MYAIIESGGKQYRVKAGDLVRVERIQGEVGQKLEMQPVLLVQQGDQVSIGQPHLAGACVVARIEQQGRSRKIRVFRMRRRKRFRKTQGHRQDFTGLRIEEIRLQ
ncbi:MAG: 50S ribosomal protein L21 [bacterium]